MSQPAKRCKNCDHIKSKHSRSLNIPGCNAHHAEYDLSQHYGLRIIHTPCYCPGYVERQL